MKRTVSAIGIALILLLSCLASFASAEEPAMPAEDPLSLWTDCEAKAALIEYVEAVTNPDSSDFIPVEDRIVVSDMDGTLFCETDPVYFDHLIYMYRVTEDPDYKDKASDNEKAVAVRVQEFIDTGVQPADLDDAMGAAMASAFAGMTLKEFYEYVKEFKQRPMTSYEGMTIGGGFYLPMMQVVDYLQANGFTFYIVSGCERFIIRGLFEGSPMSDIPNSQIIGSDLLVVASNQGDAAGLDYKYTAQDELVLGGEFLVKNGQFNKVTAIDREIGKQPVLSFGNSSGDTSMANYVICNNRYRALAFMNCCDDTERENGDLAKAEKMYALCEQYGWIPVSMKNDWVTIYGDSVTYLVDALDDAA